MQIAVGEARDRVVAVLDEGDRNGAATLAHDLAAGRRGERFRTLWPDALAAHGDLLAARDALTAMLAAAPGDTVLHRRLAHVSLRLGDVTSALHHAGTALAVDPGHGDALAVRAGALLAAGRPVEAAEGLAAAMRSAAPNDLRPVRAALRHARRAERRWSAVAAIDRLVAAGVPAADALLAERARLVRPLPVPRGGPPPAVPVDAVYLWVDGDDPAWQERLRAATGAHTAVADRGRDRRRYQQHGELAFSLRCLHDAAPWVRRVFVVTDGQVPHDVPPALADRLTIVDHRDVLPAGEVALPTFNSSVIEAFVHHVPGLAEHFLYLNDDTVIGAPIGGADVLTPDGRPLAWLVPEPPVSPRRRRAEAQRIDDSQAGREAATLDCYRAVVGEPPPWRAVHQWRVLTRSLCESTLATFGDHWRTSLFPHRLRAASVPKTSWLWTLHGVATGRLEPVPVNPADLMGLDPPELSAEHAAQFLAWRPAQLCVNVHADQRDVFAALAEAYSVGGAGGAAAAGSLPADPLLSALAEGMNTRSR